MTNEMIPIYARIASQLRENINHGVYRDGEKLPSEMQLAEQFAVNRHTLRQAISQLKLEGLLRVERGRGIFVTSQTIRYPIGKRVRYNQALKAQGRQASYQLLRILEVSADTAIAKGLEINVGEPVALIERLCLADDIPLSVSTGYYPLRYFPDLLEPENINIFKEIQSISKLLHQVYNCDHIRRCTYVSARLVQPHDAKHLKLPLNQPILLVESINIDQRGKVVEYGVTKVRGDRVELVFENDELPIEASTKQANS